MSRFMPLYTYLDGASSFLWPCFVLTLTHLHRRSRKLVVHFHMFFGLIGLLLATAGFGFAVNMFTTLERHNVEKYRKVHAVSGYIASCGGMRPPRHRNESWTEWPLWQKLGHIPHRGLGFLWLAMALVALETGTHMTSVHGSPGLEEQNEKWSAALMAVLAAAALVVVIIFNMVTYLAKPQVAHHQPAEAADTKNEEGANYDVSPAAADENAGELLVKGEEQEV